jgi:hypothetical protein
VFEEKNKTSVGWFSQRGLAFKLVLSMRIDEFSLYENLLLLENHLGYHMALYL